MKNYIVWSVILSAFFISCSSDIDEEATSINDAGVAQRMGNSGKKSYDPSNRANPYDYAGAAHNEVLDILLDRTYSFATIGQVCTQVNLISRSSEHFTALDVDGDVYPEEVLPFVVSSDISSISELDLSAQAKADLTNFITALTLKGDEDYVTVHEFIIQFEDFIINSELISTADEKVILTVASVARYSLYYGKRRKDRDWDTSVANLTACAAGAEVNVIAAVNMALSTGISRNNSLIE